MNANFYVFFGKKNVLGKIGSVKKENDFEKKSVQIPRNLSKFVKSSSECFFVVSLYNHILDESSTRRHPLLTSLVSVGKSGDIVATNVLRL